MFRIIFFTLVTKALTDSSASLGHIKYSDASGAKVDWKLYAPYSQFKSQLQNYQRRDSSKSLSKQSEITHPAVENPEGDLTKNVEPRYRPFSQVPSHLKQLLTQSYETQTPYVNPDAFLHQIPQLSFGQVIPRKSEPMKDRSRTQSTMIRAQDYEEERDHEAETERFSETKDEIQLGRNQAPVTVASNQQPLSFDKSVPLEIQQILHYQAMIPYNVIANNILYKPVKPFVPEPLLEDEVGPYKYRSRVYYAVKNDMRNDIKLEEQPISANLKRE